MKIERALKTDIRFGKAAKKLDLKAIFDAAVTSPERYLALRQTLLLGALSQLWLHADEHIGEDDILRGGVDDINELVGIDQLCEALPVDWLQVIDADHVKLPDFVAHNGTSARERKLNAERQARFRDRHRNTLREAGVTPSNGSNDARQDKTEETRKTERGGDARGDASAARPPPSGSRLPEDWKPTPDLQAYAMQLKLDPAKTAENFRDYWIAQAGARGRKADWTATWRTWCRREAATNTPRGNGAANGSNGVTKSRDAAAWQEAETHAAEIGFRRPAEHESVTAYTDAMKRSQDTRRAMPRTAALPRVAALVAKFRSTG